MSVNFTLVSTVFNEAKRLSQTIDDLKDQTVQPAEIIITDAGSNDGTYETLLEWSRLSKTPIVILREAGCNVAAGRNLAIKSASYDLIVSTDFGCRFATGWLENLTKLFDDPSVKIVGGAYGIQESEQTSIAARAAYILSGGYRVDVKAPWFIPSSRSIAYYKSVFESVGGYCEWLTLAGDDTLFGKQLLNKGLTIHKSEYVGVFWGRHTRDEGFIKEAYRYGLGDGEARVNKRNFISNSVELILRYFLIILGPVQVALVFLGIISWQWLLLLVPLLLGLRSYKNYFKNWRKFRSAKYNGKVLIHGIGLMEKIKWNYLKGYIHGFKKAKIYHS